MEVDSESASAVADKKPKYGGMPAASFYGSPAAAAGAIAVKEERREPAFAHPDVSVIDDDDGVENGGERAKGKGEINYETELVAQNLPPARCCTHAT